LADTDWLSDDLTKDEVQLMENSGKNHLRDDPREIYVLYTFETSQVNIAPPSSTATSRSLIRNRLLFALGILLMELCLNKPFPGLWSELHGDSSIPGSAPATLEDINECLDEVYDEAGDEYGYAVQRCLRCDFPGRDREKSFSHAPFRTHFFRGVVAPVQAMYEMIPNPTVMMGL
jgi:hypothetical protein